MLKFSYNLFLQKKPPLNTATQAQLVDALEPYLPLKDRDEFTKTSGTFRRAWLLNVKREELMHRVLWNNQKGVEALLEQANNHPTHRLERLTDLLCKPILNVVTDPSGKPFKNVTPFEAALCTGNQRLCELLKSYFEQIPNGLEIIQAQIKKIFPEGFPEEGEAPHIQKQKQQALAFKEKVLKPLIAVMIADTTSEEDVIAMLDNKRADSTLGSAIADFREEIKKLSYEDPISNPFYLQEAFNLYGECFNRLTSWDQKDLFCIQVIGLIQCYSSAADLQAFAQGLQSLVDERKPFQGSFEFAPIWNNEQRLNINMKELCGLGFHYVLDPFVGCGVFIDGQTEGLEGPSACYSKFLSNKNKRLYEFSAEIAAVSSQLRNTL